MEYQVDGMFWGKNGYGPRKVLGVMQEVQKMIATWKGEYEVSDSFGILVYNDCAGYDHHSYSYKPNNAIFSYRYGKCNIVVFRSKLWNSISDKERDRFENGMIRLQNTGLPIKKDYKGYPEELAKKYFSNWGFMGMVAFKRDLSFREANTKHRQWPGHWAKVQVNHADRKFCDKYGEYYFVLGGYL
uniref:Uncharacterized protein n=1 Tax=Caenorhabditis japonica TaxID=281687 RepID=A0A8R1HKA9_CAEJA